MRTSPGEPRGLRTRIRGVVWLLGAVVLALAAAYVARRVILPFILAIFLTYLLLPLVNVMSTARGGRRATPRALASFLALAAFIGVVLVAALVLAPLVAGEANRLARAMFSMGGHTPPLARRLAATFSAWRDTIYGTGVFPPDVERQLDQEARDLVTGLGEAASRMVRGSFAFFPRLLELVAVPLLTFYMLLDGPRLAPEARGFLPPSRPGDAQDLMKRWHGTLTSYVRGQLFSSLFIGVGGTIRLWVIGLRMAPPVGAVSLFPEAAPVFGPAHWGTVASAPALAQAATQTPPPISL